SFHRIHFYGNIRSVNFKIRSIKVKVVQRNHILVGQIFIDISKSTVEGNDMLHRYFYRFGIGFIAVETACENSKVVQRIAFISADIKIKTLYLGVAEIQISIKKTGQPKK